MRTAKLITNSIYTCRDSQVGQGTCLKNRLCQSDSDSRHLASPSQTWLRSVLEFSIPAQIMLALSKTNVNYYIYIIRCKDGSLYTGYTRDINERVRQHNFTRYGAKSIRGRLPVELVYSETYTTKTEALKREIEIKGWRKEKKEQLINSALALSRAKCLR